MVVCSSRARRRYTTILAAAAGIAGALVASGATAHAYPPPSGSGKVTQSSTAAGPGQSVTVSFQFTDANGRPEGNTPVRFALTGPGCINPTSGTTDAQGNASTTYTAPPCTQRAAFRFGGTTSAVLAVARASDTARDDTAVLAAAKNCGTAVITGSTADATAQTSITVPCTGSNPLPFGSTAAPGGPSGLMLGGTGVLVALVVGGAGSALLIARRRSLTAA